MVAVLAHHIQHRALVIRQELLGLTESADSEVDPDDSAIEEVLEDPEKLLDQA